MEQAEQAEGKDQDHTGHGQYQPLLLEKRAPCLARGPEQGGQHHEKCEHPQSKEDVVLAEGANPVGLIRHGR